MTDRLIWGQGGSAQVSGAAEPDRSRRPPAGRGLDAVQRAPKASWARASVRAVLAPPVVTSKPTAIGSGAATTPRARR